MSLYFNSLPFKNLRKNLFPHMIPIHPTLEAATGGALYKKGVLRNVSKLTGKHLCQSLFCNKVAGLRPATLLKKRLWHRCLPVNFEKFLRKTFLQNTFWQLLLILHISIKHDIVGILKGTGGTGVFSE